MRATSFFHRDFHGRLLVVILMLPELGFSQAPPSKATFTVKGYSGQIPVIQVNGKSYIEIDALARLTSGSISFQADRIALRLAAPAEIAGPAPPPDQAAKLTLSKDFLTAEIEAMTVIREWRIAIVNAIRNNYPVNEAQVAGYGMNADSKLALANAAAVTVPDRNVLPLLSNEFRNMQALSERYLAMRKSLTYISPDYLDSDPSDQQILSCARGLASLAASGQFEDVPVCH